MVSPLQLLPAGAGTADSDEQLFRRFAAERSTAALEALYDRHAGAMITFAARMLGDRSLARDALQETWINAIEHAREWAPSAQLRTWLFRILRNICLDQLRSRGVRLGSEDE